MSMSKMFKYYYKVFYKKSDMFNTVGYVNVYKDKNCSKLVSEKIPLVVFYDFIKPLKFKKYIFKGGVIIE